MKRIFITFVSTALLLNALSFNQAAAAGKGTTSTTAQARAARIRFAPRYIRGASRKLRYTIKARYPQAVGAKDARIIRLNQKIKDLVAGEVYNFRKDFQTPEEQFGPTGSTFESDYRVMHSANNIVSLALFVDTYYEGAVHGNHASIGFNYDLNSGYVISLVDLFKHDSNYLEPISAYCIKALTKELGENSDAEWIQRGAGPSEENYRNWNITSKGLIVTFNQYEVAPYSSGPQEVIVPYSILKNVINPEGPLARVAGKQ
ncbi:MAG TPA: DUF3298 domain-containing protein [Pyrinomonadaceae bacterium]